MKDHAMLFENIVERYLFESKKATYFANYFGDNFKTRAILFMICFKELEVNSKKYSPVGKNKIERFIDEIEEMKDENIIYECIEFFEQK